MQPETSQDEKTRRGLHRNMFLLCEAILVEPEGFHLKKEKQKKPRKALASHKFVNNSNTIQKEVWMISKG